MENIVIYERDDLMSDLLKEWLISAGYPVRPLAEASDLAPPRLVIVSIGLPLPSEPLLRAVRQLYPGTPVLALSSQARSGLSLAGDAAHALGVERILAKPLTRLELLAAVHSILGPPRSGLSSGSNMLD
jgi:DNA-binding response OmpR family regulator